MSPQYLHFESPHEFLLCCLGSDQIICHDKLLEVQVTIPISVKSPMIEMILGIPSEGSPEHMVTEVDCGHSWREELGKLPANQNLNYLQISDIFLLPKNPSIRIICVEIFVKLINSLHGVRSVTDQPHPVLLGQGSGTKLLLCSQH